MGNSPKESVIFRPCETPLTRPVTHTFEFADALRPGKGARQVTPTILR